MGILKKIFSPGYPDLDWIQVGITTRCNASCVYCPHAIFRDSWDSRDLSLEAFKALVPAFPRTGLVYLQGWGEPLLHPRLFDMLEMVKKKGCMAGLTSNANLLTRNILKKLTDSGLDFLSLSVAGIDEKNDVIRKGTSLKKVREVIQEVNRIRVATGTSSPRIHLAYMLLKSGLDDISAMPDFFNSLEVEQVVISDLTLAFTPEMEKEMYLADSQEGYQDVRNRLLEMKKMVDEPEKIYFHLYNPYLTPGQCSENIQKATYMSVDGYIRPCVCTDFPGFSENQRMFFNGISYPLPSLEFGNIKEKSLATIWNDQGYKSFRENFFSEEINRPCVHCAKRYVDDLNPK